MTRWARWPASFQATSRPRSSAPFGPRSSTTWRTRTRGAVESLDAECIRRLQRRARVGAEPRESVGALDSEYAVLPDVPETLARLRSMGLELAVVGNWDLRLREHLERLGLAPFFSAVVSSADAGAPKPDARPFLVALELVGGRPERALHVGDSPADEEGPAPPGMSFLPAPLATVPERLGRRPASPAPPREGSPRGWPSSASSRHSRTPRTRSRRISRRPATSSTTGISSSAAWCRTACCSASSSWSFAAAPRALLALRRPHSCSGPQAGCPDPRRRSDARGGPRSVPARRRRAGPRAGQVAAGGRCPSRRTSRSSCSSCPSWRR